METMYQVFKVDVYCSSYGTHDIYIGARTKQDLVNFFKKLASETYVHKYEDKEDLEDSYEETHNKLEDFTGEYIPDVDEFIQQLTDERFPRITEVKHMFTDQEYKVLDTTFYCE